MWPILFLALGIYAISKVSGSSFSAKRTPIDRWPYQPGNVMVNGQHYFFCVPFTNRNPDMSAVRAELGKSFDGLYILGDSNMPQPYPRKWENMSGYVCGFGQFKGAQNNSAPLAMMPLVALGATQNSPALVWGSLEDHVRTYARTTG